MPGLIQQVRQVLGSTRLMVLIRPRGGDFVYSSEELEVRAPRQACTLLYIWFDPGDLDQDPL